MNKIRRYNIDKDDNLIVELANGSKMTMTNPKVRFPEIYKKVKSYINQVEISKNKS